MICDFNSCHFLKSQRLGLSFDLGRALSAVSSELPSTRRRQHLQMCSIFLRCQHFGTYDLMRHISVCDSKAAWITRTAYIRAPKSYRNRKVEDGLDCTSGPVEECQLCQGHGVPHSSRTEDGERAQQRSTTSYENSSPVSVDSNPCPCTLTLAKRFTLLPGCCLGLAQSVCVTASWD